MNAGPAKLPEKTLAALAAAAVVLVALSCAVHSVRTGSLSLGWTTAKLRNVRLEKGYAYIAPTNHPELSERIVPSPAVVLEDGIPLPGPAGSTHDAIRALGRGRTSFWGRDVYFSASDNSRPTGNGRTYSMRYPRYVGDGFAFALYAATLLAVGASAWFAAKSPRVRASVRFATTQFAAPLLGILLALSAFSFAVFCAGVLNWRGMLSLGWTTESITTLRQESGFAFVAPSRHPELASGKETALGVVLEDGVPLPGADDAPYEEIRSIGRGRYSFGDNVVKFAASDNSSPLSNGRSYALRYPRRAPALLVSSTLCLSIVALVASLWLAIESPEVRKAIARKVSFSLGLEFYGLTALTALLLILSCATYLNRKGYTTLGWRTDELHHIHPESGFAFRAPTFHPELSSESRPSQAIVLENGRPFPRKLNASHDQIRKLGGGRFSFWGDYVFFSASDDSAPGKNGREYSIRFPRRLGPPFAYPIYAVTMALSIACLWFASKVPPVRRLYDRAVSYAIRPPYYYLVIFSVLALALSYATYMNRQGMLFLGWKTISLYDIHPEGGFAFGASTNNPELGPAISPSSMEVLEDGSPLRGPAAARHDDIRFSGKGRYSFWGQIVFFSTSDNSDPRNNQRTYKIHYHTMVRQPAAIALYVATFLLTGAALNLGRRSVELRGKFLAARSFIFGPGFSPIATLAVILIVLSCFAFLNRSGMVTFAWRTDRLVNIQPENGYASVATTHHQELDSQYLPSPGEVLEDGASLPRVASVRLDDVRRFGNGRYLFIGEDVYFSPPDNSTPTVNGRTYSVRYPAILGRGYAFALYTITLLISVITVWAVWSSPRRRQTAKRLGAILTTPPFLLPTAIVVFFFLVSRLAFFLYFPVVEIGLDSGSYLELVKLLRGHFWLYFDVRTPGYPLFVWPFSYLPEKWLVIAYVQNALSLSSALLLTFSLYRLRPFLAIPVAIAIGAFFCGSQASMYDTAILSESLYTNAIILAIAFLFLGFAQSKPIPFLCSSAAMAYTILIRPAGMYFLVIFLVVFGFLVWNRYRHAILFAFLTPFIVIILILCSYNLYTLRSFTISPFGEANLAGATVMYWEPDSSLPAAINEALKDLPNAYARAGITDADRKVLNDSWDPGELMDVFNKQYNQLVWTAGYGNGKRFGHLGYLYYRQFIRQIALRAIRRHPIIYIKYVWTNLAYYFENITYRYEFFSQIGQRVRDEYVDRSTAYEIIPVELVHNPSPLPKAIQIAGTGEAAEVILAPSYLARLDVAVERLHWSLFLSRFWIWAFLAITALCAIRLVLSRGRHLGAFLLLILSLVSFGGGLVVALVEIAMNRYSYPTQFIYYLIVACSPLLWVAGTQLNQLQRPR